MTLKKIFFSSKIFNTHDIFYFPQLEKPNTLKIWFQYAYMCLLNDQTNYQVTSIWVLIKGKQISTMVPNKSIRHVWKLSICWARSWWRRYFFCWSLLPRFFFRFAAWSSYLVVFFQRAFILHLRRKAENLKFGFFFWVFIRQVTVEREKGINTSPHKWPLCENFLIHYLQKISNNGESKQYLGQHKLQSP